MVRPGAAVVGALGLGSGLFAVFLPDVMYALWPQRRDAAHRMLQAWGISSAGLGLALCGASIETAAVFTACLSLPWDLAYVPESRGAAGHWEMGKIAAGLNLASIGLLTLDRRL